MNPEPQIIKFLLDNATGLSISALSLYLMFRLFDKHLSRITSHLHSLEQLLIMTSARQEQHQKDTEKTLWRLENRPYHHNLTPPTTERIEKRP